MSMRIHSLPTRGKVRLAEGKALSVWDVRMQGGGSLLGCQHDYITS